MKHSILPIAILFACSTAIAGGSHHQPKPSPSSGSASSSASASAVAAAGALAVGRGGAGGAASAAGGGGGAGGMGGSGGAGGSGGSVGDVTGGSVSLAGASIGSTARSAPGVYGIASPPAPSTCDGAGFSIGGSGTGGGGLLNLPGGERASCLAVQESYAMERSGFPQEDQQRRLCALPSIAKTKRCKALAEMDRAQAPLDGAPAPVTATTAQAALLP